MWKGRRRLVRPEWNPTHNPWRATADPLRSSVEDTAALAAASPLFAAHRGLQVFQEPAHAAPDPKGPFLPESDHLLFASWPARWERSRPSESNAPTSRSTASDAALTPCPANLPRRRTREPSPSIRWEARHGLRRFVLRGDSGHGSGALQSPRISMSRPRLRGRTSGDSIDGLSLGVQLGFRLRFVPVRSRRDVLELRLEKVVQDLLRGVLHLRKDLAGGRRADSVHRVRVDGALPVNRHEVRDLLRAGEELSLFVREVQLPHSLGVRLPHGPCGPPEHGQKARLAVPAFRMIWHLANPDLFVKMPALETQQMHGLGRQVESHPVQDLLPFRLRGEQFRRIDVAAEDRIGQRRRRLVGAMNHDLDLARSDLVDNFPDSGEVRVEEEGLPHRLVVDWRVREADLERSQVAFADREGAANRSEPLRDALHVVAQGEVVRQEGLEAALERLLIEPQQAVHERLHVELAGVGHEFVQDPVRVRPPEPDEVLAGEELLDQVAEGDVHDLAERCVNNQETIERLDDDPVVRRDGGARLAVVRVLLDQTLRAGLVDRPRFLEVLDGLRDTLSLEPRINLLADPPDALREAERHRQHLAVPAGDHRVRVGHRGHVDHAVLPDLLDFPGASANDEVQSLAGLDDHELLAEDADLPLRREVHDRIAAFVPNRREVLEVIAAALRRDADLVPFLTQVAEMSHELRNAIRLDVFQLAERIRRADRRKDLRPRGGAPVVQGAADDLVGENVKGETMDVQRLEVLLLRGLDRGEGFDGVIRGDREDESLGGAVERVARAADPLDEGRDLTGRVVLDDSVDGADVDAEV